MAKTIFIASYIYGKASLSAAETVISDSGFYTIDRHSIVPIIGEKLDADYISRSALFRHAADTLPDALAWLDKSVEANAESVRERLNQLSAIREEVAKTRTRWEETGTYAAQEDEEKES